MRYMTWIKSTTRQIIEDTGRCNIDVYHGSGVEKMDLYGKTLIKRVMSGILRIKIDSLSISNIEAAIKASGDSGQMRDPKVVAIKDGWRYTTISGREITFTDNHHGPVAIVDFEAGGNTPSHYFAEQIATYARYARKDMGEFYNV